jgi:hypothetical protein
MFALLQLPFSLIDRSFSTPQLRLRFRQKINVHIPADRRFELALKEGGKSSTHRDADCRAVSPPG